MIRKVNQQYRDNFLDPDFQQTASPKKRDQVDENRVSRLKRNEKQIVKKQTNNEKTVVKMNLFREEARMRQRQFHQQTRQFLRMSAILSSSAIDENKFAVVSDQKRQGGFISRYNLKKANQNENYPIVTVNMNMMFSEAHLKQKFSFKETYLRTPFRKQSIQFNPSQYVHPDNDFFVFQYQTNHIKKTRKMLEQTIQQTFSIQFKNQLRRIVYYLSFFDYIYMVCPDIQKPEKIEYSNPILQIAQNMNEGKIEASDSEQSFDQRVIEINQIMTDHRIVSCTENQLGNFPESLYFSSVSSYMEYKTLREIQFKNMKIYAKDIQINTDVRNIISSEKIYLIEIMKEIQLLENLAKIAQQYKVIKSIYSQLIGKSNQFLKLICGYTKSKVAAKFNIQNMYEKIYQFIYQCIKYGKKIQGLDSSVLQKFPYLEIWYKIPQQLFGYQRKKLQQTFYSMLMLTQELQMKIKFQDQYQNMKSKQTYYKYYGDVKIVESENKKKQKIKSKK